MAFNQTLSITQTDCCDTIQICDTTCEPNPCNATPCVDGYSVAGNINKWDVKETAFNITFPDGSQILGLDIGYVPNNKAYGTVTLTAGTTGTVQVQLTGYGILGVTTFSTSLAVTASNLVSAINSNSANSGWSAFVDATTPEKIWFYNSNGDGAGANGAPTLYTVTGDMAVTGDATVDGGTNDSACMSLTLAELWALNSGTVLNNNNGPAWADGVYGFTYITYDAGKVTELGRVENKFLFDCNVVNCIKENLLAGDGCNCSDNLDDRILKARLKVEAARHQFNECLFDCANETILKAGKLCNDVCIDC